MCWATVTVDDDGGMNGLVNLILLLPANVHRVHIIELIKYIHIVNNLIN